MRSNELFYSEMFYSEMFFKELQNLDFCWKKSAKSLIIIIFIACALHFLGLYLKPFNGAPPNYFPRISYSAIEFSNHLKIIISLAIFGAFCQFNPKIKYFLVHVAILPRQKISFNYTPLMLGGCIFIVNEHLNIPLITIINHAIIPCIIIYIAYFIDNNSQNINSQGKADLTQSFYLRLLNLAIIICAVIIFIEIINIFVGKIENIYGNKSILILIILSFICYISIIFYASLIDEIESFEYHYFLPIILLPWLLAIENMSPEIAVLWAVGFLAVIIITADALKSSFMQKKRLKKPKIASELLHGIITLKNCAIISAAWSLFFTYHGVLIWAIFEAINGLNYCVAIDWSVQPNAIKILICIIPLLFLPYKTPVFWRYILVIKLYKLLAINIALPNIEAYLLLFYATIAIFAVQQMIEQKSLEVELVIPAIIPILIYFNDDLILLSMQSFQHSLLVAFIAIIATMSGVACLKRYWVVQNQKIESFALGFAAIILFVPDLFMNFASNRAFNYLPINLQIAAKYVVYFPVLCMVLVVYIRQRKRLSDNV